MGKGKGTASNGTKKKKRKRADQPTLSNKKLLSFSMDMNEAAMKLSPKSTDMRSGCPGVGKRVLEKPPGRFLLLCM
ncbi:hypothetical protein GQ600_8951 [Phytophthora cactorum]|nr:hypothetical protein GQ600_8951 [Phytophthora cactorum]